MPIDPIAAADSITEAYINYLATTFKIQDDELQRQFKNEMMKNGRFAKGPILEATPPFVLGKNLNQLIEEGVLCPNFSRLGSENLPLDRPLYWHQEQSIRKVVQGRNIVVATGTGSGKTEAFLIPILNHLLRQKEENELGPGVRALLLYPMNALANDQIKRLRKLLMYCPDITFGRYTGETPDKYEEALGIYTELFNDDPLDNELICRGQMRESPPNILLTNYAMLEYLLLRPRDNVFFDSQYARDWRFVVLDEAHTYAGTKGMETAMLLRRLKDRVHSAKFQCIATSATLGNGEKDFDKVAEFASKLFAEPFEWETSDEQKQDIISAKRVSVAQDGLAWGKPKTEVYLEWHDAIRRGQVSIDELSDIGRRNGVPNDILSKDKQQSVSYPAFLFNILKNDGYLIKLRSLLEDKPAAIDELAANVFSDSNKAPLLVALVDLAVKARLRENDAPLLPARYHMFVRAIEGAYMSLYPDKKLYLERCENIEHNDKKYPVFELATCRQCGAAYLVGISKEKDGLKYLKQTSRHGESVEFYLLSAKNDEIDDENGLDEDDDIAYSGIKPVSGFDKYTLCPACGCIEEAGSISDGCSCGVAKFNLIRAGRDKERVYVCPGCGRRHPQGLVWRFIIGAEAASSVLATALYQQIYPENRKVEVEDEVAAASDMCKSADYHRAMLIFSDSRQDAAFFAPYLDDTYNRILRRRLIIKAITDSVHSFAKQRYRLQDLVEPIHKAADQCDMFSAKQSLIEQRNEVLKWLMHEFTRIDSSLGLEAMGLLAFEPIKPANWRPPEFLINPPWSFTEQEVWTLFRFFLDQLRINGAVAFPEGVNPRDEIFHPKNREYYFRKSGSSAQKHIYSWMPGGKINSRLDFIMRLVKSCGIDVSKKDCLGILADIWDKGWKLGITGNNMWSDYFTNKIIPREGVVYRLDYRMWELDDTQDGWYRCDKCHNLTRLNIRSVCPAYQCDGHLQPYDPERDYGNNHYRKLYKDLFPQQLKVKEHTAQLSSRAAGKLQTQFIKGDVNALSCSTTFELGVDVGDLETVFLRNMPPSPANYIQRAGRAGRRTSSTAFVLTYAQRRSHDLAYFHNPIDMVAGKISAPHFDLVNPKIIRRHIHSLVLADFWRQHENAFGKVEDFFFNSTNIPALLGEYLQSEPKHILESLKRIVPENMHDAMGLDDWSWVKYLMDPDIGVLTMAELEVTEDVKALDEVYNEKTAQHQYADHILRAINTIMGRELIDYLANHNVLPKYGFPVDVVELQLPHVDDSDVPELELQRDLRIAISEYAPDSQVVAGGRLWTSRYLKRIPQKAWPKYRYAICECGNYKSVLADTGIELGECDRCHKPFEKAKEKGFFVMPEFGFIADNAVEKPSTSKPERTYSLYPNFTGKADEGRSVHMKANGMTITATAASHGKIAVLNTAGDAKFMICNACGYAKVNSRMANDTVHKNPQGFDCHGGFQRLALGHEFETDILQMDFGTYSNNKDGFWLSLLYAILEGAAEALNIERQDIDGCLYPVSGSRYRPALILFDDVPGGAGHVNRIADEAALKDVLNAALKRVSQCECGGEKGDASCYGCLRNYRNQRWHDMLNRGMAMEFLKILL